MRYDVIWYELLAEIGGGMTIGFFNVRSHRLRWPAFSFMAYFEFIQGESTLKKNAL